ncbi:MAG: ABC transporter ATP-binding protein [Ignavibacteriales bacterium]|nr:MAG: ABC transporter ATP-binding protein [Ignavibacteriales bacterium]
MITLNNYSKQYGSLKALSEINLNIPSGSLTFLVGPNASGKTTLIKSLLGLVKPTSGNIAVNGITLNGDYEYRKEIGYVSQIANFPDNLTVDEIFRMVKDLREKQKNYDEELVSGFQLEPAFNKRLKTLSGGTRQKVNVAVAFLFDPKIIILDEPTAGLDPVASSLLKDKILKENKKGKTIIFTSHILSEMEELAQNVVFLLEGKIFFNGTVKDLINSTNRQNLERAIASIMNGVQK